MLERRIRDEEGETVSYSGPCLAELLAASGERRVLSAAELAGADAEVESGDFGSGEFESVEACDFESVESTVVIAGSRPRSCSVPLVVVSEGRWAHDATGHRAQPVWPDGELGTSGSFGAVAYTLAPRAVVDVDAPRRGLARPGVALLLASLGVLVGLCVGTAFAADAPRPARAPAVEAQPRERLAEATPLVSPTHQKIGMKRKGRTVGSTAPSAVHAAAPAASPPAIEGPSDAQQLEDRRLLLAAQAEHSF